MILPISKSNADGRSNMAANYDQVQGATEFAAWLTEEIENRKEWIGIKGRDGKVKVLDYGAGTGVASLVCALF